jgi:hypothetical protein
MQLKVRVTGRITADSGEVISLTQEMYLFTQNHFLSREDTKKLREIMFGKFLAVVPELGHQDSSALRGFKLPSLSTLTCRYKILERK